MEGKGKGCLIKEKKKKRSRSRMSDKLLQFWLKGFRCMFDVAVRGSKAIFTRAWPYCGVKLLKTLLARSRFVLTTLWSSSNFLLLEICFTEADMRFMSFLETPITPSYSFSKYQSCAHIIRSSAHFFSYPSWHQFAMGTIADPTSSLLDFYATE